MLKCFDSELCYDHYKKRVSTAVGGPGELRRVLVEYLQLLALLHRLRARACDLAHQGLLSAELLLMVPPSGVRDLLPDAVL